MSTLTRVTATFAIGASGYGKADLDVTGLTPDEMAVLVFDTVDVNTTLCHQCAGSISDPEVEELVGFRVGDVDYVKDGDHWVVYQP